MQKDDLGLYSETDNYLLFFHKQYCHFLNYINKDIETVFHYTSIETMEKILKTSSLRFTNINHLNDECELTYFFLILEEYLLCNKLKFGEEFCANIINICAEHCDLPFYFMNHHIQQHPNRQFYISSFSLTDDNLSLWTLYTKEKNFMGCNFGITPQKISIYTPDNSLIYGKVLYNQIEQEAILDEIITNIFYKYETANDTFWDNVNTILYKYALFFKHPAFEQENEYRLIYYPSETFNIQNKMDKPFIDIPFNIENDINNVKLSPTLRERKNLQDIKNLFKQYKVLTKDFTTSNIPFRT